MNDFFNGKFAFDNIIVDPQANLIIRNGVEKRLEPKIIALLCLFASRAQHVITRQQITEVIWPDVVVGEESITRAIFALRNALNDDAKQPKYIETIPKKGYRFLAEAKLYIEHAEPVVRARPHFLIATVSLMLFIGLALLCWHTLKGKPGLEIDKILPVTKLVGSEGDMNIQPALQKMVFVHNTDKKSEIYVRALSSGTESLVTNDDWQKYSPIWIDEFALAYIRCSLTACEIVRQYEKQAPEVLYTSSKTIFHLGLAGDKSGDLVFTEYENNESVELRSINLRNGKREMLRDRYPDLPKKIYSAHYSVDSKKLFLLNIEAGKPTLFSIELATKKLQKLNDSFEDIKSFSVAEGRLLVSGTYKSTQGLWSLPDDVEPVLLLRASGDEQILSAVVDSKTGAIYYQNLQTNIDVALVANNNLNNLTELNSNGNESNGIFSEDGKAIYFVSNRSGYSEVWRYSVESNQTNQITDLKALSIIGPIISMDGKLMAVEYRTDKIYLGIVALDTGKLVINKSVPAYRFPLAWSHDDKYIYASEHEAQVNLFRYDTKTLDVSIVQKKAGLFAQESADGKKLKFIDYERDGLIERDLTSGAETVLNNSIQGLNQLAPGQLRLNADKTGVLAISNNGTQRQLNYYPFANKTTLYQKIMDLPDQSWVTHINDRGDKILLLQTKPPSGDIMKIQFRQ